MLRSVEIIAELALEEAPFHNLHWKADFEFSIDCFICQRVNRTTLLTHGAEHGTCSGPNEPGTHPAAARISVFDHTHERERSILRTVLDYWWAPFHDAKRNQPSLALTRAPWIRLYLGYLCPGTDQPSQFCIQSNVVRPQTLTCERCTRPLAYSREAPRIQLLT